MEDTTKETAEFPAGEQTTTKKQRDLGFELLRIFAMVLITCVHLLNYGGFLSNANSDIELMSLRFLYSLFATAVNIFVLISSYFLIQSRFKFKKLLNLWFSVVFYAVTLYIVSIIFFAEDFTFANFIKCFFPIILKRYWFFTAYVLMYIASPFLNKILNNSTPKELYILCLLIFALSCCSRLLPIGEISGLMAGYNFIWFICLYIIGGTLRLHPPTFKKYIWAIVYILSTLAIFACFYIPSIFPSFNLGSYNPAYSSPLVLLASISIFMLFRDIHCKNTKNNSIVTFVSSSTFGIYLFQETEYFKPNLYFNFLSIQNNYATNLSIFYVLMYALVIFLMGFLLDCVRKGIFKLCTLLCSKIKSKHISKKGNPRQAKQ